MDYQQEIVVIKMNPERQRAWLWAENCQHRRHVAFRWVDLIELMFTVVFSGSVELSGREKRE